MGLFKAKIQIFSIKTQQILEKIIPTRVSKIKSQKHDIPIHAAILRKASVFKASYFEILAKNCQNFTPFLSKIHRAFMIFIKKLLVLT